MPSQRRGACRFLDRRFALLCMVLVLATPAVAQLPWAGADGKPLPFEDEEELLAFLRDAKVVAEEGIPVGVTKPRRLTLREGDVELDAIFRFKEDTLERVILSDGTFVMSLKDTYKADLAAYELDRLMGLHRIPPTVERLVGGAPGSVQIWIEGMTEAERQKRRAQPPDSLRWRRLMADLRAFDNLIANIDRNAGNLIIDPEFEIWWIDHTRSFGHAKKLPKPESVNQCSRQFIDGLRSLDEEEVTARLRPLIGRGEVKALLRRRQKLLALIDGLVASKGESEVLFDYSDR